MLDNLFVGFAGDEVMTAAEGDGVTVQNCEVGWVGDIVAVYNTGEAATGYGGGIQRLAGAIGGGNHGTRYRNNYVHHMLLLSPSSASSWDRRAYKAVMLSG